MAKSDTGGAGPLDRARITTAAIALIDAESAHALSMRKLGASLSVEAMAIYHYFTGRDEVLDSVVETVINELHDDPDLQVHAAHWEEYLYRTAHAVRRIALAHPQVFPLIATRPPAAPWIQPPLRSLRWIQTFLQALQACGFADENAVAVYQAFSSFLLGHLLLEVSALGADVGPVEEAQPTPPDASDLDDYPLLKRLEPLLSRDRGAEEFEEGLEALIERLTSRGKR
ncbi:DNA-binding transcriptional regulator, AcrR family [Nakamurella panacisegetis]|uniref:DNA-binding transcriptional regulator, AcrR family n=1 Tax=Nakamurella panacisegetis TaxID=1090615 RepID=A0A1H0RFU6_9ACTN|nr:TetR/AcrR family transcriptional regulator C-terminal domain-containing protein [Nakamurella panacisegetis]SDP28492.1 DNA-binding transcriptional regulator, AcrR family [Nakamurella panacisegetis]